jgi:hypothetical protein
VTPAEIDFSEIDQAVQGAGYTLKTVTVELEGQVETASCETCVGEVAMLRVAETGQLLELTGDVPTGQDVRVKASVSGWAGTHAVLAVQEWQEALGDG